MVCVADLLSRWKKTVFSATDHRVFFFFEHCCAIFLKLTTNLGLIDFLAWRNKHDHKLSKYFNIFFIDLGSRLMSGTRFVIYMLPFLNQSNHLYNWASLSKHLLFKLFLILKRLNYLWFFSIKKNKISITGLGSSVCVKCLVVLITNNFFFFIVKGIK